MSIYDAVFTISFKSHQYNYIYNYKTRAISLPQLYTYQWPWCIYHLFQGEGGTTSSRSTHDDDSDHDDPADLGYFEPIDSDDSDDSTHHYEEVQNVKII